MALNKMGGIKAAPNSGKDLVGRWHITLKIDGARMHRRSDGTPVSRADKPLYNLQNIPLSITDAEVYAGNWEKSMSLVRTKIDGNPVKLEQVYSLDPLDPRLDLGHRDNPTHAELQSLMENKVSEGYEGLIVRQDNKWLKYKPSDTADVFVTEYQKGTGKHKGKMGALLTNLGKVGTGFSDADRLWWHTMYELHGLPWLQDQLIEVSFMEWTKGWKFRHPVFERIRDDKRVESLGEAYEGMYNVQDKQEE